MVDFGEGMMVIESFRVPWLLWIQILVFLLLMLLLYVFGLVTSDLSDNSSSSFSSTSASWKISPGDSIREIHCSNSSRLQSIQTGEFQSIKGELDPGTTGRVVIGEGAAGGEGSSRKGSSFNGFPYPCRLIQLVKTAFLKCLGLGYMNEDPQRSLPKKER